MYPPSSPGWWSVITCVYTRKQSHGRTDCSQSMDYSVWLTTRSTNCRGSQSWCALCVSRSTASVHGAVKRRGQEKRGGVRVGAGGWQCCLATTASWRALPLLRRQPAEPISTLLTPGNWSFPRALHATHTYWERAIFSNAEHGLHGNAPGTRGWKVNPLTLTR